MIACLVECLRGLWVTWSLWTARITVALWLDAPNPPLGLGGEGLMQSLERVGGRII